MTSSAFYFKERNVFRKDLTSVANRERADILLDSLLLLGLALLCLAFHRPVFSGQP
ncbi:hypothetical membrane protein [Syntrophus aciditrophicus SB]|uniref:Hypothetical membrane protein n=1 Tax=Syntrophus aciditrophicus (strain SB) TaxID=56780 RepID=Q2LWI4_SYNAS|nr:hypothetical membrane protein [Syntrophus aciditrophicus SB]